MPCENYDKHLRQSYIKFMAIQDLITPSSDKIYKRVKQTWVSPDLPEWDLVESIFPLHNRKWALDLGLDTIVLHICHGLSPTPVRYANGVVYTICSVCCFSCSVARSFIDSIVFVYCVYWPIKLFLILSVFFCLTLRFYWKLLTKYVCDLPNQAPRVLW